MRHHIQDCSEEAGKLKLPPHGIKINLLYMKYTTASELVFGGGEAGTRASVSLKILG